MANFAAGWTVAAGPCQCAAWATESPAATAGTVLMPIVNFVNEKKQLQVPEGANLRKEALKAGIPLYPGVHKYLNCHGLAQCASCRVLITKGRENASPMGL